MTEQEGEEYKKKTLRLIKLLFRSGCKQIKDGDFIFHSSKSTEKLLNKIVSDGYLLHGSSRKICGELLPSQARDLIKESGNRKAIYITKVPAVAMFCALTGGNDRIRHRKNISHMKMKRELIEYSDMFFGVDRPENVMDKGYVYVIGINQINEEVGGEFLSYNPVVPMAVIEIDRNDFVFEINKI